jgi:hypothetical protein
VCVLAMIKLAANRYVSTSGRVFESAVAEAGTFGLAGECHSSKGHATSSPS